MTGSEAEVIALRLRDTFNRFNLSAHPTYFAGIPREGLSALLQANRRAELIQLAVDGFLTFVVAGDLADITLSRTTRSRFLRKLAVALRVEKRNFDQAELIRFTRNFASKHDFEIDPIQFIHAFIDKGVLYFEGDAIRFSLSFIESYLLALELTQNEALAADYFMFEASDFDLYTFDLYCEISPSERLIQALMRDLESKIEDIHQRRQSDHILLDITAKLPAIESKDRLKAVQRQLRAATKAVQEARNDAAEKQRLLDIADRIREQAARQSESVSGLSSDSSADSQDWLVSAAQSWG
jgi:hypothetical protein